MCAMVVPLPSCKGLPLTPGLSPAPQGPACATSGIAAVPDREPSSGVLMKARLWLFGVLAALTACVGSTEIVPVGPDTYTVSASAASERGGAAGARIRAIKEAGRYCTSIGRELLVTNITTRTIGLFGDGSSDIIFRCLPPGDPDLRCPDLRALPNVVIENRR
jgi:hypothetical protein